MSDEPVLLPPPTFGNHESRLDEVLPRVLIVGGDLMHGKSCMVLMHLLALQRQGKVKLVMASDVHYQEMTPDHIKDRIDAAIKIDKGKAVLVGSLMDIKIEREALDLMVIDEAHKFSKKQDRLDRLPYYRRFERKRRS